MPQTVQEFTDALVYFPIKSFGGDVSHMLLKCKAAVKLPNIQAHYPTVLNIVDVSHQDYISISVLCTSNLIVKAVLTEFFLIFPLTYTFFYTSQIKKK